MNNNNNYNNGYGPDMDSEFTFGPRSIYLEEMSRDAISEFTDPTFSTIPRDEYDPVGGQWRKAPPPTGPRRVPPPQPPPPPQPEQQQQPEPPQRSPSQASSRHEEDGVGSGSGDIEEYRDEYDGDENNKQDDYVSRVASWYSNVESKGQSNEEDNDDEEDGKKSLVSSQATTVIQSNRDKRLASLLMKLIIACICLFFIAAVGAFAFAYFFSDMFKNDDSSVRGGDDITNPPTDAPTSPPTDGPTPDRLPLTLYQAFNGPDSFGQSVSMDHNWLVVGAPANGGLISAFYNDGATWRFVPEVEGSAGSSFGAAVDIVKPLHDNSAYLLVGAPTAQTEGIATLYRYNDGTNTFEPQSAFLQGKEVIGVGDNERFGSAVALSENLRAVVGAPQHDMQGGNSGRIYTFQYTLSESTPSPSYRAVPMTTEPLVGLAAGSRFGEAVDITRDGSWIGVGEPGRNSLSIYAWKNALWLKVFEEIISDEGDFGSSVKFLSNTHLAVGSPLYDGGRGRVRVYEKGDDDTTWTLLPVLDGNNYGDGLGQTMTLSGRVGPAGPELVLGTAKGAVERYDLLGGRWVQRYYLDQDHPVTAIDSVNSGSDYLVFAGYSTGQQSLLFSGVPPPDIGDDDDDDNSSPTTVAPTVAPTTGAPTAPLAWNEIAGPFTTGGSIVNTKYGHAVALVENFLAIGEPEGNAAEIGDVAIYDRSGSWRSAEFGFATNTLQFGYSLDARTVNNKASVIVGAIDTKDEGDNARFGSAHVFERDATSGWQAVGGVIRPNIVPTEAAGDFGASVAMASMASGVRRIVVGAPSSSLDVDNIDTGRVYTFEFDGTDWIKMTSPIVGRAGKQLGFSVDISKDGTRMLAGSPGGTTGTAYYYEWTGSEWNEILNVRNGETGEGIGTSVCVISDDGKLIAFGGPNHGNDEGVVRVYREADSIPGFFFDIVIVGAPGERIGTTIAGAQNRVAFGTDTGSFRVYELKGSTMVEVATGPVNLGSKVVSIDMSDDARTVALGLENEEVVVYELS